MVEMTQLFTARDDRPWTVVPFIRGGALGVVFRGRAQIASVVVAFPSFSGLGSVSAKIYSTAP